MITNATSSQRKIDSISLRSLACRARARACRRIRHAFTPSRRADALVKWSTPTRSLGTAGAPRRPRVDDPEIYGRNRRLPGVVSRRRASGPRGRAGRSKCHEIHTAITREGLYHWQRFPSAALRNVVHILDMVKKKITHTHL